MQCFVAVVPGGDDRMLFSFIKLFIPFCKYPKLYENLFPKMVRAHFHALRHLYSQN